MLALPGIKETRNNVGGFVPNSGFESINVSRCSLATRERMRQSSSGVVEAYGTSTRKPQRPNRGGGRAWGVQHSGRH